MFPFTDPEFLLDLHNQHAAELRREATAYRRAHDSALGRRRHLFARRPRPGGHVTADSLRSRRWPGMTCSTS
ncbi:MAG: hypothetical protein QOE51_4308 [Actinoplanes sp.]|jgi:hypothetical protein|nr:hypothetical protein [Actinoplanes sp.]